MKKIKENADTFSTGLAGFDHIIESVLPGDNIVWQVDSIEDFLPFVLPYCKYALSTNKKLIYFRFGTHPPFLAPDSGAEIIQLDPDIGFESFTTQVNAVITKAGFGHYYVFDLLSELALKWCNDRMLGNFFMQTCPYLYENKTVTAFALLRDYHSFHATRPIFETAQIVINVYKHNGDLYVHPTKVTNRYSPTMNTIHLWKNDEFIPIRQSGKTTEVLSSVLWFELDSANERLGFWARTFAEAENIAAEYRNWACPKEKYHAYFLKLLNMTISRDERIIELAEKYFSISDIIKIRKRMIGTGLIGGKSVGMLLARAIIEKESPDIAALFEPHDSFFIGSDVFYTFLVRNRIWHLRQRQREAENVLEGAQQGRQLIMEGQFPEYLQSQFINMLDYFGQFPIIVRSSSLLEDNYGNAFAGKYKSFFCANRGTRQERLEEFINAVKKIYASSMSTEALTYRARRGLLQRDEPMALLVQRVSGAVYGKMFFPQCAGVGFSFNPYAWDEQIDPEAGMLRLVFGLGTRAVDRVDDDYTRIIALNAPQKKRQEKAENPRKFSQRKVDLIDLEEGRFCSKDFRTVIDQSPELPADFFIEHDQKLRQRALKRGHKNVSDRIISFKKLLQETDFAEKMRAMLEKIEHVYGSSVDIEFTMNLQPDNLYKINLLQCRPLELRPRGPVAEPTALTNKERLLIHASGSVLGHSRLLPIDRIVYVVPEQYSRLSVPDRYAIARLIGRITHLDDDKSKILMLLGPGRWATSTPSLGVPVSYSEINTVDIIVEIAEMSSTVSPDISLGTHFFSDLIESNSLYLGFKPQRKENLFKKDFFANAKNLLEKFLPDMQKWAHVVRIIEPAGNDKFNAIKLYANALEQRFACYFE
jgi:pyruvate,water dikinase